jgi:predicted dinucleotide-binding enzyme
MSIAIIGAGLTGRAIAGALEGAGAVLLADCHPDRAKAAVTGIGAGVIPVTLEEALGADIVVLALSAAGTLRFARENALRLLGKWVVAVDHAPTILADELPLSTVFVATDEERATKRVMDLVRVARGSR